MAVLQQQPFGPVQVPEGDGAPAGQGVGAGHGQQEGVLGQGGPGQAAQVGHLRQDGGVQPPAVSAV